MKIYITSEEKTPYEKTISIRLNTPDFFRLENLKEELKENYSNIIRKAIRNLYKEKRCQKEKNKKQNTK